MKKAPYITPQEEQELMALSGEDGWVSVGDIEERRAFWQAAARRTLDGERQRISISIPKRIWPG